ncbi:hypothetical protein LXL04_018246 [Taraxacum kok-saghyz]
MVWPDTLGDMADWPTKFLKKLSHDSSTLVGSASQALCISSSGTDRGMGEGSGFDLGIVVWREWCDDGRRRGLDAYDRPCVTVLLIASFATVDPALNHAIFNTEFMFYNFDMHIDSSPKEQYSNILQIQNYALSSIKKKAYTSEMVAFVLAKNNSNIVFICKETKQIKFFHGFTNETKEEIVSMIKDAVWCCGNERGPGPNEFTFKFLKHYWELIRNAIVRFWKDFEDCIHDPLPLKDYRPVNRAGCIYNILSKAITNTRKKVLDKFICHVQIAYVKGEIF